MAKIFCVKKRFILFLMLNIFYFSVQAGQDQEVPGKFYEEYIAKYYPKAYVIQRKFFNMSADEVPAALDDIIHVFTKKPWFYFRDTPKGFKLVYFWEYIIDQLSILHCFLVNVRVDKKTKKMYWPNMQSKYNFWSTFSSYSSDKQSILFADYLKANFIKTYTHFYALSYDYNLKMFNEGILLRSTSQVNRYLNELEYILGRLKNTPKEADYEVSTNTCKRLQSILRRKLGFDNFSGSQEWGKSGNV